jgi:hypothetical protein
MEEGRGQGGFEKRVSLMKKNRVSVVLSAIVLAMALPALASAAIPPQPPSPKPCVNTPSSWKKCPLPPKPPRGVVVRSTVAK